VRATSAARPSTERSGRLAIGGLAGLIALSAAAGGLGLVGGGLPFPAEWLAGTPFSDYALPGLILGVVVGGSALAAAVLVLRGHPRALPAAAAAGLIQVGWIVGEVVLVGTHGPVMLWLQVLYFALGAALAALAGDLWLRTAAGEADPARPRGSGVRRRGHRARGVP
jgi:hypothetical protein